jgi:hypothetical protein
VCFEQAAANQRVLGEVNVDGQAGLGLDVGARDDNMEGLVPRLLMLMVLLIFSVIATATGALLVPLITGALSTLVRFCDCSRVWWRLNIMVKLCCAHQTGLFVEMLLNASSLIRACVASGRQLLTAMNIPLRHDMYVIAAGCYALWASCKALAWLWRVALSHDMAGKANATCGAQVKSLLSCHRQ